MNTSSGCHCGSQHNFDDCCGAILCGHRPAQTAEQLMRSRYSAFCEQNIDYLIATHHPSKRLPDDAEQLTSSMQNCQWLSLKILDTQLGGPSDDQGEVEFVASYTQSEKPGLLHERSRFRKEQEQWFYVDGDLYETPQPDKLGRNDPCWCGSGKKFKKCHG